MRRSLAICGAAAWISILLLSANPVWSQSSISLHGKVTDPSGAAIPNATVHLINSADNSERTTTADQQGSYSFSHLTPGTYRVVINAQGFQTYEKAGIQLLANEPATLDVQLTIEQLQQSVTVKAQPTGQCVAPLGRILPGVGPGLRAIRRGPSGNYYVLTAPGSSAVIYSPAGKRVGQIPAQPSISSSIVNGSDIQVDSSSRVYVADFAANAVKIYSPQGILLDKISVPAPISVEPLPRGEVAVASLYSQHIVDVYDQTPGDLDRSFGDINGPVEHCDAAILRCTTDEQDATALANRPWFYGDAAGNLYVSVGATPAPTIRKYDPYGIRAFEFSMPLNQVISAPNSSNWTVATGSSAGSVNSTSGGNASSSGPAAGNDSTRAGTGGRGRGQNQGMLRLGLQLTQHAAQPASNPAVDAIGVDPANSDVWVVIGDDLVHLDRSGELDASYCLSTSAQSEVKFTTILIEPRRILLGSDPFGVFEYPRPDKPSATGPPSQ